VTAFLEIFIDIDTLDHDTFVANVRLVPLILFLLASFHFFFNDDQHSPLSVGPSSSLSSFRFLSSYPASVPTPSNIDFRPPRFHTTTSSSLSQRIPCFDSHSVMQLVFSLQNSHSRFLYLGSQSSVSCLSIPVFQLFDRYYSVPQIPACLCSQHRSAFNVSRYA